MKYALLQVVVLAAVVGALVLLVRGAVETWWGLSGVRELHVAALICGVAAIIAALPLGVAATYWPAHAPLVALAGTGIRLLGTGFAALAYQALAQPLLAPFLFSLLVLYLGLLLVETGLIVYILVRVQPKPMSKPE